MCLNEIPNRIGSSAALVKSLFKAAIGLVSRNNQVLLYRVSGHYLLEATLHFVQSRNFSDDKSHLL